MRLKEVFENISLASGDGDYVGRALSEEFKGVRVEGGFGTLKPVLERTYIPVGSIGKFDEFGIRQKSTILTRRGRI